MAQLAKLTRPRLHKVVARERLFARLDEVLQRPLTWVAGPPGAGKTSLLASYADARRRKGAWYQVDAGDADPGTFFHYLGEAVPAPKKGAPPLPLLGSQHSRDLPGFARIYFRALFARLKAPALLVFDNWHELPLEAPVQALIEVAVKELPEGLSIAVTSRTPPPQQLAALRAQERLALLEWDELRLDFEEARQIASSRHAPDEATLRMLHESTDGWPVGLVLLLEEQERAGKAQARDGANAGRAVLFDYFAGQAFAAMAPARRQSLMLAALLPRADAAQATQLTGGVEAAHALEDLYRRRLFVDKRGEFYQFHDLFRAFLLQQFALSFEAAEARRWRSLAARQLAVEDRFEEAFALACDAEDWETAVPLILANAARLFEQGRAATVLAWTGRLPPALVDRLPWLVFWRAVGLSGDNPAAARARFGEAYERFLAEGDTSTQLLCCGGVIMTHYLEFDTLAGLDPWIDRAQALFALEPTLPAPAAELRVRSALLFALSFRRPEPRALAECIAQVQRLSTPEMPANARATANLLLAHFTAALDFPSAEREVAKAREWLDDPQLGPFFRALWFLQRGNYHLGLGEHLHATEDFQACLRVAADNAMHVPLFGVHCHVGLARLALARGDLAAADAARLAAVAWWTPARRIDSCIDVGLRALLAAHRGDALQTVELAGEQHRQAEALGIPTQRFHSAIQYAVALVAAGRAAQAAPVLELARALVAGTAYEALAFQVDLAQADASVALGDMATARAALARGLAGSRRDPGMPMLRLLPGFLAGLFAEALRSGIEAEHALRLVRRFRLQPPEDAPESWPWPIEIRTFGKFEIRRDGEPLAYARKTPKKTLALLKAIVALGSNGVVSEQRLLDALWPDEEGDAAANSLAATVLRLRTLIGDAGAIAQGGGKLSLDRRRVWVDAFAFEQALAEAEASGAARRTEGARALARERALRLYEGAFLAGDEGEAWPVAARERLRGRFIHALAEQAGALERDGDLEAAVRTYLRGLDADAAVESFYPGLMRCYSRLGRRGEAIGAYQRLKQILSITLGLAPSAASERLYQGLRAGEIANK
jgi:DNA-binding SARP family transcriptional activator